MKKNKTNIALKLKLFFQNIQKKTYNFQPYKVCKIKVNFLTILIVSVVSSVVLIYLILNLLNYFSKALIIRKTGPTVNVNSNIPVDPQILFNNQPNTQIFSDNIIAAIDKATKSLEIAMYSFSSPRLKEAVYRASNRGLKVTIISDARKEPEHQEFFADAPTNLKRLNFGSDSGNKTILMHHKFLLIDRGEKNAKLFFGSYNWTDLQEKYDPSFVFISNHPDLIASFGSEFDRLSKGQAGPKKLKLDSYHAWDLNLNSDNKTYEVWFGPGRKSEGINSRISELIKNAKQEIKIIIWDFTDRDLATKILNQAKAGIKITIITDTWNFHKSTSVFNYLKQQKDKNNFNNLTIISDEFSALPKALSTSNLNSNSNDLETDKVIDPFLHYHVLIVDNKQVLFGTNNWSGAGSYFNDEAAIVSSDQKIIDAFAESFDYHYQQNIQKNNPENNKQK